MTDTEKQAREWLRNRNSVGLLSEDWDWLVQLLAAYGSSEYERGLRDGREQAAVICESYSSGNHRHVAEAIRQISEGGFNGR